MIDILFRIFISALLSFLSTLECWAGDSPPIYLYSFPEQFDLEPMDSFAAGSLFLSNPSPLAQSLSISADCSCVTLTPSTLILEAGATAQILAIIALGEFRGATSINFALLDSHGGTHSLASKLIRRRSLAFSKTLFRFSEININDSSLQTNPPISLLIAEELLSNKPIIDIYCNGVWLCKVEFFSSYAIPLEKLRAAATRPINYLVAKARDFNQENGEQPQASAILLSGWNLLEPVGSQ